MLKSICSPSLSARNTATVPSSARTMVARRQTPQGQNPRIGVTLSSFVPVNPFSMSIFIRSEFEPLDAEHGRTFEHFLVEKRRCDEDTPGEAGVAGEVGDVDKDAVFHGLLDCVKL